MVHPELTPPVEEAGLGSIPSKLSETVPLRLVIRCSPEQATGVEKQIGFLTFFRLCKCPNTTSTASMLRYRATLRHLEHCAEIDLLSKVRLYHEKNVNRNSQPTR